MPLDVSATKSGPSLLIVLGIEEDIRIERGRNETSQNSGIFHHSVHTPPGILFETKIGMIHGKADEIRPVKFGVDEFIVMTF
jgi:hypothetical protein